MRPVIDSRRADAAGAPLWRVLALPAGAGLAGCLCCCCSVLVVLGCCTAGAGGGCCCCLLSGCWGAAGLLAPRRCALSSLAFLGAVSGGASCKLKRLQDTQEERGTQRY
jgi:hypothetical protein